MPPSYSLVYRAGSLITVYGLPNPHFPYASQSQSNGKESKWHTDGTLDFTPQFNI